MPSFFDRPSREQLLEAVRRQGKGPHDWYKDINAGLGTAGSLYGNIAREGIYGQGGINSIMGRIRQSRDFQRRALARSMRRRFGTRLGPRSGAVDALVTNRVFAPAMQQDAALEADLLSRNLASRTTGAEGLLALAQFLQGRIERQKDRDLAREMEDGGGFMDFLKAGTDIARTVKDFL